MAPECTNIREGSVAQGNGLQSFFNPGSVALFGSMQEGWFFGPGVVIKDLREGGYKGTIYPVHPTVETVYGLPVYRDVRGIPGDIELAVVITSWRHVPGILKSCGERGVKAAVVVSDGFGEMGEEGRIRERELVALAESFGLRIIGPNTLGILNTVDRFTTVPYEKGYRYTKTGPLSIVTQTGMYGPQAVSLNDYQFGVNKIIDLGNMCDVDEVDCLSYLEHDEGTEVISLYIEHTRRPQAFLETVKKLSMKKPVLCLKGGRSPESAGAMASHTGSLAADDRLYEGLFRQTGVIRVDDYRDLLDCAKPFLYQSLPAGNRLGIISFSGAIGIQCIDAARVSGLTAGKLSAASHERLSRIHPLMGGHPIDLGPAAAVAGPEVFKFYRESYGTLVEDDAIDCIYFNAYVGALLKPEYYSEFFEYMKEHRGKPTVMWCYGSSGEYVREMAVMAERSGIPCYETTRKAVRALGYMHRYAAWRRSRGHEEN